MVVVAISISLGVCLAADWLAVSWINPENLTRNDVSQALCIMGIITGLRFIENIYSASLAGLQYQVEQNIVLSTMATMRAGGAILVLEFISPSLKAFFIWQSIVSLLTLTIFSCTLYKKLPACEEKTRFSVDSLKSIYRFALGMTTLTFLSIFLTQFDKLVLPKLITLESYGYYTLAFMVASFMFMLSGPISTAFYPKMTELITSSDEKSLCDRFHLGAQLMTTLMGAVAVLFIVFGNRVLFAWTGNTELVLNVTPFLSVLSVGSLCTGLIAIPYHLQLAFGWTSLRVYIDMVAVIFFIPAFLIIVPKYGAIGAACIWSGLQFGRILLNVPLMHRKILQSEFGAWAFSDTLFPICGIGLTALIINYFLPEYFFGQVYEIVIVILITILLCCSGVLLSSKLLNIATGLISLR
jgi:O-antigen/teichoic acid export membrane protein